MDRGEPTLQELIADAAERLAHETSAPTSDEQLRGLLEDRERKHDAFRLAETAVDEGRAESYSREMSAFDAAHGAVVDWLNDTDHLSDLLILMRGCVHETSASLPDALIRINDIAEDTSKAHEDRIADIRAELRRTGSELIHREGRLPRCTCMSRTEGMQSRERGGADAGMRLQALCQAPITVYVAAYAKYGEHCTPRWAKFTLGAELLVSLWMLADVVKDSKLQSVCRRRNPDAWSRAEEGDPGDPIPLEGGLIQFTDAEEFRFLAEVRDGYTLVSTDRIELEELIKAAEGPAQAKARGYERRGSVVIFAKECDREAFIRELSEDGERVEEASTAAAVGG